jgi:hypothetical protein
MSSGERSPLERFETDLHDALAWTLNQGIARRMDDAVAAAIAAAPAAGARSWRWPRGRLIPVVGVALLLMGAASAITLLHRTAELIPGHRVAYERAERLTLSQTVGAYTVNLERAYADPNQLVLMFTVRGPEGASQAVVRADVVDTQGRSYLDVAGGDLREEVGNLSASVSSYQVPPGVGNELQLTATVPELQPYAEVPNPVGPWVFRFSLPVHPAVVVEPRQTIRAAGVPITLQRVQITATAVRVQLDLDLSRIRSDEWSRWSLEGTLQQRGQPAQELTWAALPPEWTGQPKSEIAPLLDEAEQGSVIVRQTFAGTDTSSGRWTLTIQRLTGADGKGGTRSVDGPWVFTFDVP